MQDDVHELCERVLQLRSQMECPDVQYRLTEVHERLAILESEAVRERKGALRAVTSRRDRVRREAPRT